MKVAKKWFPASTTNVIRCSNCSAILGYRKSSEYGDVVETFVHGDTGDLAALEIEADNRGHRKINSLFELIANHYRSGIWDWKSHDLDFDEGFVLLSDVFGQMCKAIETGKAQYSLQYLNVAGIRGEDK